MVTVLAPHHHDLKTPCSSYNPSPSCGHEYQRKTSSQPQTETISATDNNVDPYSNTTSELGSDEQTEVGKSGKYVEQKSHSKSLELTVVQNFLSVDSDAAGDKDKDANSKRDASAGAVDAHITLGDDSLGTQSKKRKIEGLQRHESSGIHRAKRPGILLPRSADDAVVTIRSSLDSVLTPNSEAYPLLDVWAPTVLEEPSGSPFSPMLDEFSSTASNNGSSMSALGHENQLLATHTCPYDFPVSHQSKHHLPLPATWDQCHKCEGDRWEFLDDYCDHTGIPLHDPDGCVRCHVVTVSKDTPEYKDVAAGLECVGFQVENVYRIQNMRTYESFHRKQLEEAGRPWTTEEATGYHVTRAENLKDLLTEGLDQRLSARGRFGRGLYFAEDPRKSDFYWRGNKSPASIRLMLRTKLLLGRKKTYAPGKIDPTLRREPRGFDSVEGEIGGQKELVVYDSSRAMIEYAITYKALEVDARGFPVLNVPCVPPGHVPVSSLHATIPSVDCKHGFLSVAKPPELIPTPTPPPRSQPSMNTPVTVDAGLYQTVLDWMLSTN